MALIQETNPRIFGATNRGAHSDLAGRPTMKEIPECSYSNTAIQERFRCRAATVQSFVANTAKLQLLTVMRKISELKSRLQRTNPVEARQKYNQMFSELVLLEAKGKELHTRSIGAAD